MRLELVSFRVRDIEWGSETRYGDGTMVLDRDEILDLVRKDQQIKRASVEIARPGDSVRIINYTDKIEPRVKVDGGGTVYPGILGRSTDPVGSGRTHCLKGLSVISCLDIAGAEEAEVGESRAWAREDVQRVSEEAPAGITANFIDMSGPGAVTPFASLVNLCLVVEASRSRNAEEQHAAIEAAAMRIADRMAATVEEGEPDEVETFEIAPQPDLPSIVYIPHLASTEPHLGARATHGTAVYGQVRLSAPWFLDPTEVLDGAVAGGGNTWVMANNPVVLDMCRRHGTDINFVGSVVQRTNWTSQMEYSLAAHRAALMAKRLGAVGAIISTDVRGQRWVGTMLTLQACEQQGIKVVLLTEEEDNEEAAAPSLLFAPPELEAVVSTGTGDVPSSFPAVSKVIGTIGDAPQAWYEELPPIHGRYGVGHLSDWYGFGKQSYADF